MVGLVGQISFVGGIAPTYTISTVNGIETMELQAKSGQRILCSSYTLTNESTLVSNGTIKKDSTGFVILKDNSININRNISTKKPLTIIKGRSILYADAVRSGSNSILNLPKGVRVNGVLTTTTGEVTIPYNGKFTIDY